MHSKSLKRLEDILHWYANHPVAMDECHAMLIYGMILASKPYNVIEFGIGTGQLSQLILAALSANEKGYLTIVDNFIDWKGKRPDVANYLIERGANIIVCDQEEFIKDCKDSCYDMIVSDANHSAEPKLIPEFRRIAGHNGIIFIHDINTEAFFKILETDDLDDEMYSLFNQSSLTNERCERGLFLVYPIGGYYV